MELAEEFEDLSITITDNFKFHKQMNSICMKSDRESNRIRRCFIYRSPEFLWSIYKLCVRPLMEYYISVWNHTGWEFLPWDISPWNILPYAQFVVRRLRRKDISPWGHFAVRTLWRKNVLPLGHFAKTLFDIHTIRLKLFCRSAQNGSGLYFI